MMAVLDEESLAAMGPLLENPAMVAMFGRAYAADFPGFGPIYTNMMLLITAIPVAIMNIFFVMRNTRADEEKGRYEVVRSLPIGRLANINAAMLGAIKLNVVSALIIGFGMFALGDDSMGLNGSLLFGASLGASGLVFAAIAALFAQLSSNSRGAMGYSFGILAFFYLLRAPGDMNPDMEILAYISPLGLMYRTQPYMGNYWWPIFVLLGTAVVISAAAYRFNFIRDIDQGLIPAKPGRAHGKIKTPYGLASRLLRTSIIAWLAGMFLLGASYATVFDSIDDFIATNQMYQDLILGPAGIELPEAATPEDTISIMRTAVRSAGYTITELFASMISMFMGLTVMIPALIFMMRAKGEEKDARSELLLATPVSRAKYLGGYAIIAFASSVAMSFAWAIGMYATAMSILPDPNELSFSFMMQSSAVYIPAVWVMIGVAIFFIGAFPKFTGIVWAYFGYSFFIMLFGRMGLFDSAVYFTPFGHLPNLPVEEISYLTLSILTLIAAGLTAMGFIFYSRRDTNAITN